MWMPPATGSLSPTGGATPPHPRERVPVAEAAGRQHSTAQGLEKQQQEEKKGAVPRPRAQGPQINPLGTVGEPCIRQITTGPDPITSRRLFQQCPNTCGNRCCILQLSPGANSGSTHTRLHGAVLLNLFFFFLIRIHSDVLNIHGRP